jgi:C2 domain
MKWMKLKSPSHDEQGIEKDENILSRNNCEQQILSFSASPRFAKDDTWKGILQVDILEAFDLPLTKRFLSRKTVSPFVIISFARYSYKTKYIRHSDHPCWNERLVIPIKHGQEGFNLFFAIYDHDKLRHHILLATGTITVQHIFHCPNDPIKITVNLSLKHGNDSLAMQIQPLLLLRLVFIPSRGTSVCLGSF